MKKYLLIFLAVILCALLLSSCGGEPSNSDGNGDGSDTSNLGGASSDTDTEIGITPGENELPALPLTPSSSDKSQTVDLQFTYAYAHETVADTGEGIATLLVSGSYLMDGFESVKIPADVVAGDVISLKHTGELITQSSYPGKTHLHNGELKSYSIKYAEVICLSGDEVNAEQIKSGYDVYESYVIIDKTGRYTSLDEYEGTELYLVLDRERMTSCEPGEALPVACMLAYNPRSIAE